MRNSNKSQPPKTYRRKLLHFLKFSIIYSYLALGKKIENLRMYIISLGEKNIHWQKELSILQKELSAFCYLIN